ncbi:50S ribosomal protein L35 [Candidatus Campbellbacteria bacterium]|nr:MAG: 50S ribosomal protein L35 [Candidatus Campbellbacteria bacterium]
MKTNKSLTKRLKLTKNGKVKRRAAGRNHFNSKESNKSKMAKKKDVAVTLTAKIKSRFLPKK